MPSGYVTRKTGLWIECWDVALREKTAPMVAEIDMKLLTRYPDAAIDDPDRRREWIDHVESRERGDKRKRTQHKREQQRLKVEAQRESGPLDNDTDPITAMGQTRRHQHHRLDVPRHTSRSSRGA